MTSSSSCHRIMSLDHVIGPIPSDPIRSDSTPCPDCQPSTVNGQRNTDGPINATLNNPPRLTAVRLVLRMVSPQQLCLRRS